jgi:hypothetical protein
VRVGSFDWFGETGSMRWSEEMFPLLGYAPGTLPRLELILQRLREEEAMRLAAVLALMLNGGVEVKMEQQLSLPDGTQRRVRFQASANPADASCGRGQMVELAQPEPAMAEPMGEAQVQPAPELCQPLSAVTLYAHAALRWLTRDEPDIEEARKALLGLLAASNRAHAVLRGADAHQAGEGPGR